MNEDFKERKGDLASELTEGKGCLTWVIVFVIAILGTIILLA